MNMVQGWSNCVVVYGRWLLFTFSMNGDIRSCFLRTNWADLVSANMLQVFYSAFLNMHQPSCGNSRTILLNILDLFIDNLSCWHYIYFTSKTSKLTFVFTNSLNQNHSATILSHIFLLTLIVICDTFTVQWEILL